MLAIGRICTESFQTANYLFKCDEGYRRLKTIIHMYLSSYQY